MSKIIQFPGAKAKTTGLPAREAAPITYITCTCESQAFRLQSDGHLECTDCSGIYHPDTIWAFDEDGWVKLEHEDDES